MNIEALIAVNERNIAAWEAAIKDVQPEVSEFAARFIEETRWLIARTRKINEALRSGKFYS